MLVSPQQQQQPQDLEQKLATCIAHASTLYSFNKVSPWFVETLNSKYDYVEYVNKSSQCDGGILVDSCGYPLKTVQTAIVTPEFNAKAARTFLETIVEDTLESNSKITWALPPVAEVNPHHKGMYLLKATYGVR